MQSLLCDIKPAESAGTKGVDGFYQEATIKEQAHKLSPALRVAERGASRACSTDSALAGTKGNKHCSLIKNLCQNTGKADLATRGLSLVEVLVGAAIGAVVMLGTAKTLAVALQSSNIVRTIVTEQELKGALTKAMSGEQTETKDSSNKLIGVKRKNCARNLAPVNFASSVSDADKAKGIGEVDTLYKVQGQPDNIDNRDPDDPDDEELISIGSFRGNIEVVKMELIDPSKDGGTPSDPTTEVVSRRLIVRYKKTNLGQLNTVGNKECSSSDQSGCYFHFCNVDDYKLVSGADANSGADQVEVCQSYDCFQYGAMTASKKYCVHEDCFNGGCLRWSDKKPKDKEKQYSFVEPFTPDSDLDYLKNSRFNIYTDKKGDSITIRTGRENPIQAQAKGGCCTIKKYYINKALEMLKSIETNGRNSKPIGIYCDKILYGPSSLSTAIDSMLHPSINPKCSSDVPKNFATFLTDNISDITIPSKNRLDTLGISLITNKICIRKAYISRFDNHNTYEHIVKIPQQGDSSECPFNTHTYYFIRRIRNPQYINGYESYPRDTLCFPFWDNWPNALTLP